jgi:hypothetical protein
VYYSYKCGEHENYEDAKKKFGIDNRYKVVSLYVDGSNGEFDFRSGRYLNRNDIHSLIKR